MPERLRPRDILDVMDMTVAGHQMDSLSNSHFTSMSSPASGKDNPSRASPYFSHAVLERVDDSIGELEWRYSASTTCGKTEGLIGELEKRRLISSTSRQTNVFLSVVEDDRCDRSR